MPVGDVRLFTIGYTSSLPDSQYKRYPIKKKYKQVVEDLIGGQKLKYPTPESPEVSSFTLVSETKYWYPWHSTSVLRDIDYLVYADGDEFDSQNRPKYEPGTKSYLFLPNNIKVGVGGSADRPVLETRLFDQTLLAPPKQFVYANNVFVNSGLFFYWTAYDLGGEEKNPYNTNAVYIWYESTDADKKKYWYHPFQKRFWPLKNDDILRALSEKDGFYLTGSKWENFTGAGAIELNLSNFTKREIEQFELRGLSTTEAESAVNAKDKKATAKRPGASSSSSAAGASTTEDGVDIAATVRATIKRSVIGAGGEGGSNFGQPQMVQIYRGESGNYKQEPDRFIFTYRPNNVSYSNIGSEWTEIDRVNNTPFVDFRNFKLMKISFEFVVGDNNNLFTSCDEELSKLRRMAMRPEPVLFLGFDKMFSEQLVYPSLTGGSGVEFAIVDMSINSVQRTRVNSGEVNSNFSPSGEINRASVSITLQELPINNLQLVKMPKLVPDKPIPEIPPVTKDVCRRSYSQAEFQKLYGVNRKQYCGTPGDKAGE